MSKLMDDIIRKGIGLLFLAAFWGAIICGFTYSLWWLLLAPFFYFGVICFLGSELADSFNRTQW